MAWKFNPFSKKQDYYQDVNNITFSKILTNSTIPTIAVTAGTGGTGSLSTTSTDVAGIITINTGTGSVGSTLATITFSSSYANAPNVIIYPNNAQAAGNGVTLPKIFITSTINGFSFQVDTTTFTASQTYKWFYHIIS